MQPRKRKLTLTVDADTVEKAKRLGINISEVTESALRNFAFDPKDETRASMRRHYQAMFQAMLPMLAEYETSVHVASFYGDPTPSEPGGYKSDIYLQNNGSFWVEPEEAIVTFDKLQDVPFLEPDEILKNYIDSLEKAKQKRRERIEDLELVRRIVEAISPKPTGETGKVKKRGERRGGKLHGGRNA